MIIGIDASRANKPIKTGIEWYSYHLINHLIRNDSNVEFRLYTNNKLTLKLSKLDINASEAILSWPFNGLWTQLRLSYELLINNVDCLFIPAYTIPIIHPKKTIVTIHDIGFISNPELYKPTTLWYHKIALKRALSQAGIIITISEFTKKEIIRLCKYPEHKIEVIPIAYNHEKFHTNYSKEKVLSVLNKYDLNKPYLLTVGRIEKKKNPLIAIKSVELYNKQYNKNVNLVLVGKLGFKSDEIINYINKNKLNFVKHIDWIHEDDLPVIYLSSLAYLTTSLYEGFGITPLEAMACGTPVICSRIPPFEELYLDSSILVNPVNIHEIAENLMKITSNKITREGYINAGLLLAKKYNYEKCAIKTLKLLK